MPGPAPRRAAALAEAVRATALLQGGQRVLVLASAGRDSACLLDLAVQVAGAGAVHVLHVDHGLRGAEASRADADCVRSWCAHAGVELTVEAAEAEAAPAGAGDPGNLHAWARGERARLAGAVAAAVGADCVATAHTRTDLVETALGRLATQPGRRALLAMRERDGSLVRPLLAGGVTREETMAYCLERAIRWRDDPSNADASYARARVRHGVLPVLRSLNPRMEEAVSRTLAELAAEGEVLDALVDAELEPAHQPDGGAGAPSIAVERLAELPAPLGRLVLRELCERSLGAPCARAASRLDAVLALRPAAERAGVAWVDVGAGARVELRGGVIRCARSSGAAAPQPD